MTPTGFINLKKRCYSNATIQILYFNFIFIRFILNIDCNNMRNSLDKNDNQFASHYQKILILKESQKCFGEMYLCGKKTFLSNDLFIVSNIRIYCQMNAAGFEGLFYNTSSGNLFKNQIINIKTERTIGLNMIIYIIISE